MNFKQFLKENTSQHKPDELPNQYKTKISIEQVKEYIIKNCKDFIKNDDAPLIYRGMSGKDTYLLDTNHTTRKSAHTNNAYTLLLDKSLPPEYPRRSQSIICTGRTHKASRYGEVFVIIPFDNVKIGCVNKEDIWDVFINNTKKIRDFTQIFNELDEYHVDYKIKTYDNVVDAIMELCKFNLPEFDFFTDSEIEDAEDGISPSYERTYERLMEMFSADNLEFNAYTPKSLKVGKFEGAEYWIGGKSIAIPLSVWKEIGEEVKKSI